MGDFETPPSLERFNTGAGYYFRVNNVLTKLQNDKLNNDVSQWFMDLICLYTEIHAKCNPTEETELTKKYNETINEVKRCGNNFHKVNNSIFISFELHMRKLLDKKGMLTPKGDDPSQALGRGGY